MSALQQLQSDVAILQTNYGALSKLLQQVATDIQTAITDIQNGDNSSALATLDATVQAINTQVVADTTSTQTADTGLEGAEGAAAPAVPATKAPNQTQGSAVAPPTVPSSNAKP